MSNAPTTTPTELRVGQVWRDDFGNERRITAEERCGEFWVSYGAIDRYTTWNIDRVLRLGWTFISDAPVPEQPTHDPVNHPSHYTHGGIEVLDAIEAWGLNFCLGNVIKYVARADHKGNAIQDLRKAAFCLAREIKKREAKAKGEGETK